MLFGAQIIKKTHLLLVTSLFYLTKIPPWHSNGAAEALQNWHNCTFDTENFDGTPCQNPSKSTLHYHQVLIFYIAAASLIFGGCQIAIDLLWLAYNRIRFHEKNLDNIIKKSNKRQRIYNRHKIWVFNQLESLSLLGNFVVTKYKNKIHIEHTSSLVMGNGLIDLQ